MCQSIMSRVVSASSSIIFPQKRDVVFIATSLDKISFLRERNFVISKNIEYKVRTSLTRFKILTNILLQNY